MGRGQAQVRAGAEPEPEPEPELGSVGAAVADNEPWDGAAHQPEVIHDPSSTLAQNTLAVGVVDHRKRVVLLRQVNDLWQTRKVAVHGEHAVCDDLWAAGAVASAAVAGRAPPPALAAAPPQQQIPTLKLALWYILEDRHSWLVLGGRSSSALGRSWGAL